MLDTLVATLLVVGPAGAHDGFAVAQRDGLVVFSRRVGGRYHLMRRGRDERWAVALPVPSAETPFDVEIAPSPDDGLRVAFAQCENGGQAPRIARRRCRLGVVRADGRGLPERLGPQPRAGFSHRHPALQGERLAFLRSPDRGGRAQVVVDGRVVLRRRTSSGPDALLGLDLARYGVAVAIETGDAVEVRSLLLARRGRRAVEVAVGGIGEENDAYVLTPAFSGPHLFWGYANHGPYVGTRRSYVFRRELRTGRTTATVLAPYVTSVALDAGAPSSPPVVTTDRGLDSPWVLRSKQRVRTIGRPRWRPVPATELIYP